MKRRLLKAIAVFTTICVLSTPFAVSAKPIDSNNGKTAEVKTEYKPVKKQPAKDSNKGKHQGNGKEAVKNKKPVKNELIADKLNTIDKKLTAIEVDLNKLTSQIVTYYNANISGSSIVTSGSSIIVSGSAIVITPSAITTGTAVSVTCSAISTTGSAITPSCSAITITPGSINITGPAIKHPNPGLNGFVNGTKGKLNALSKRLNEVEKSIKGITADQANAEQYNKHLSRLKAAKEKLQADIKILNSLSTIKPNQKLPPKGR